MFDYFSMKLLFLKKVRQGLSLRRSVKKPSIIASFYDRDDLLDS